MRNIKLKIRQFFYRLRQEYLTFENIIFVTAIVLCVFWTYKTIITMSTNWELSRQVVSKKKELTRLELENETLELENDYYRTDEYKELAARRQQNKKLEGETMIYLPENSEEAKNKHSETDQNESEPLSNIEQWLSFLLGL